MSAINQLNDDKYKVLEESDYKIEIGDFGQTLFGGIHKVDYLENLGDIIDVYAPNILIVENAERCDRVDVFSSGALIIKDKEKKE